MKESSIVFVGLDVHKDSIDIAVAEPGREGEVRHIGTIGGDLRGSIASCANWSVAGANCTSSMKPGRAVL